MVDLLDSLGVEILDEYSLADLLFALLGPSSRALGGLEFADVDVSALPPGAVPASTLTASFEVAGSRSRSVDIAVQLPAGASFVPGSATMATGTGSAVPTAPVVEGSTLTWTVIGRPGVPYVVEFDVLAGVALGDVEFAGTASLAGTDVNRASTATVTIEEGLEPINFLNVNDTIAAHDGEVFLTYLSSQSDVDVFEVNVLQDDRLVVQLSNLDTDLDVVVWGRPGANAPALTNTSGEAPLVAITDPDSPSLDSQVSSDFPQLDEVDPTLGIIAVSNVGGTGDESLTTPRLDAGTYYVQVVGATAAPNVRPAAFQVGIIAAPTRPVCQPIEFNFAEAVAGDAPLPTDTDGIDTLILVNEQRLERLYGAARRSSVVAAAERLVAAGRGRSHARDLPGAGLGRCLRRRAVGVRRLGHLAGSCDPTAANEIVGAINANVIDPIVTSSVTS